jgi:dTDP-4-dehydrorhamnose reductase
MTRVIVLGARGMLGSMVARQLRRNPALEVIATTRAEFEAEAFASGVAQRQALDADYVINCIGVLKPYCKDSDPAGVRRAIAVNALFPHRLAAAARRAGARVLQIATDCVYSGARGEYVEADPHDPLDVYGKTKSLGEVLDGSVLNLRCSIVGPEPAAKVSLLEWFLSNPDGAEVKGFTHHRWNGVTTLQFARLCERIVCAPGTYERLLAHSPLHHFVPNDAVDKYELLCLMNEAFGRRIVVKAVSDIGPSVDRTLATRQGLLAELFPPATLRDALLELAHEMREGGAARAA